MSRVAPRALFLMPPFSRHAGRREWQGLERFYNPGAFFERVVLASLDETDPEVPSRIGSLHIAPLRGVAQATRAALFGAGYVARRCPVTQALVALAREHEVDLLVQRYGGPLHLGVPIVAAARALALPSIITLNSDYDAVRRLRARRASDAWARLVEARRWRLLLSNVDFVWSVSDFIRHQVRDRGFPAERTVTIPNKEVIARFSAKPEPAAMQQVLASLGLGDLAGERVLLSVGRLMPAKNTPKMIEAFAALAGEDGSLHYVIVGEGPEAQRVDAAIATSGVADRIHRVRDYLTASQLAVLYHRADALLFCSVLEGQGRVPFEAMASGTPVVGAEVGPIPEIVRDGETGALADPGNVPSIVGAARRVLYGELTKAHVARACRDMAERFDVPRVEPLEIDLYRRSLARTRRV